MQLNHIVKSLLITGLFTTSSLPPAGKDYESPLPARTDARYFLSMAAFRILRLNPALNTLSFVKILIAMCRIPENNSAAFPLLILQSSSFITR